MENGEKRNMENQVSVKVSVSETQKEKKEMGRDQNSRIMTKNFLMLQLISGKTRRSVQAN